MSFVNYLKREIHFKIVYYGPALSGKTTNLIQIYSRIDEGYRGELIKLDTEGERTLFFDFFPIKMGTVRGFRLRMHLYTVPGQDLYDVSRKIILKSADGVVFVADSQRARMSKNVSSMENLRDNLRLNRLAPERLPMVLQYNKRDLPDRVPVEMMEKLLNWRNAPYYEAVAPGGVGVLATIRDISKQVVRNFEFGRDLDQGFRG